MKPSKPTKSQIAKAQLIADRLKRNIPEQALGSELVMRMWIKSVLGLLSEKEQQEVSKPKMHEQLLAAITWDQNEPGLKKLLCPIDGVLLEGFQVYGHVGLRCHSCDYRVRQLPQNIFKLYMEAHNTD